MNSFHFKERGVQISSSLHFLFTILTCAQRTRIHFCPQHWLLCYLGVYYKFEFYSPVRGSYRGWSHQCREFQFLCFTYSIKLLPSTSSTSTFPGHSLRAEKEKFAIHLYLLVF